MAKSKYSMKKRDRSRLDKLLRESRSRARDSKNPRKRKKWTPFERESKADTDLDRVDYLIDKFKGQHDWSNQSEEE